MVKQYEIFSLMNNPVSLKNQTKNPGCFPAKHSREGYLVQIEEKALQLGVQILSFLGENSTGMLELVCKKCGQSWTQMVAAFLRNKNAGCNCKDSAKPRLLAQLKTPEDRLQAIHQKAKELNVQILRVGGTSSQSIIRVQCLTHPDVVKNVRLTNFLKQKCMHCCYSDSLKKKPDPHKLKERLKLFNCEFCDNLPTTAKQPFNVRCLTHNQIHVTCWSELNRLRSGFICCVNIKGQANVVKNPYGRKTRRNPHTNSLNTWSRQAIERAGYRCELTGCQGNLASHHLFGKKSFAQLAFSQQNALVLRGDIHRGYHSSVAQHFQKSEVTPDTFLSFLNFLSSDKRALKKYNMVEHQVQEAIRLVESKKHFLQLEFGKS